MRILTRGSNGATVTVTGMSMPADGASVQAVVMRNGGSGPATTVRGDWPFAAPEPVEVIVSERSTAALLFDQARSIFPTELVETHSDWIVRIAPRPDPAWAHELRTVLERWLDACRLPCVKVFYEGRSYLIRAEPGAPDPARPALAA